MSNPKQPWLICYSYDPLDKLTSHSLSDTPERHRFYCKNRLATEIQGAIGHSIVQHGDFLLAQQQREDNALDTTLLATDVQRSVLHTLKKDGERRASAYSPYGHQTALSGPLSLLGFNGERPDPVTGHYLLGNGYRAFNPVLMRFNSPDYLSPFGKGGLNCYAYCLGDPINFGDFNGHSRFNFLADLYKNSSISQVSSKHLTNQYNFADYLDQTAGPLSPNDLAMRNTEIMLGATPGSRIEALLSGESSSSVKAWNQKTGLHNIKQHVKYQKHSSPTHEVISAGLRGELNGVLPERANELSVLISEGKFSVTANLRVVHRPGKSNFMMDVPRQIEIYRQAGEPLPTAFGSGIGDIQVIRNAAEIRFEVS
ncbi:RHS repeat-associated core domain protein-containing protein [Pseudomonas sp. GM78]|uniref:RHS repeat-associated core domain-containing protein n=1 Tax=Pseudomonas sp. GM78 TaxID=1144337 RepID=UPI0002707283|nr:RHS repeat-associated core domain-containing protein [Pseudomonas sp. GM78]EJN25761.1 RHS repeat-associated core domain protein-containing protein [Pseudomonas sp. GM78]